MTPADNRPGLVGRLLGGPRWLLGEVLIFGVRCYQVALRPLLPTVCRFHPSCSEYFILAVRKHGPLRGACRGVWRICRCNPWNPGGYDPP
jgi:putative membrane protein insertion efficiency factor